MKRGIIVEGADGNGKSTLVQLLARDLGLSSRVCGPPPRTIPEYMQYLFSQRKSLRTGSVILDRHTPLSSYAYSFVNKQVIDEHVLLTHAIVTNIRTSPVYVYCSTAYSDIDPNKPYKTEEYINRVKRESETIKSRYTEIFEALSVTPIMYDWRIDSYNTLLNEVKNASSREVS